MVMLNILAAGVIAGIVANATGYLITGRLFHPYQARTPGTWRVSESWTHYLQAAAIRIAACIAMGFLYGALGTAIPSVGDGAIARGISFGSILWAVTLLPLVLEAALFVNWHRGFVAGLLLDWLVVCILASAAAAVAVTGGAGRMTNTDNKQTVVAFYEAALNNKDFDTASRYLGPSYTQHNPHAADGVQGLRDFIAYLKQKVPNSHSEIKRVFAEGDFVILQVHKTSGPGDRGVAIVDIFRLEHGKVVEHWDVTQEIPERTASGNPMF